MSDNQQIPVADNSARPSTAPVPPLTTGPLARPPLAQPAPPSVRRDSVTGGRTSPPGGRTSPPGGRTSPPGGRTSPPSGQNSPAPTPRRGGVDPDQVEHAGGAIFELLQSMFAFVVEMMRAFGGHANARQDAQQYMPADIAARARAIPEPQMQEPQGQGILHAFLHPVETLRGLLAKLFDFRKDISSCQRGEQVILDALQERRQQLQQQLAGMPVSVSGVLPSSSTPPLVSQEATPPQPVVQGAGLTSATQQKLSEQIQALNTSITKQQGVVDHLKNSGARIDRSISLTEQKLESSKHDTRRSSKERPSTPFIPHAPDFPSAPPAPAHDLFASLNPPLHDPVSGSGGHLPTPRPGPAITPAASVARTTHSDGRRTPVDLTATEERAPAPAPAPPM